MNFFAPRPGYSLVEMLVSMSIFAVITGMVLSNFGQGRRSDEIRFATQFVATAVRRAQTDALAGTTLKFCRDVSGVGTKRCNIKADCGPDADCVNDVPSGWGLHISTVPAEAAKMISFADLNGNGRYDAPEFVNYSPVSPGAGVSVVSVNPSLSNSLDLVFVPPKPEMLINGGKAVSICTIEVGTVDGTRKRVIVNRISGQVSPD